MGRKGDVEMGRIVKLPTKILSYAQQIETQEQIFVFYSPILSDLILASFMIHIYC